MSQESYAVFATILASIRIILAFGIRERAKTHGLESKSYFYQALFSTGARRRLDMDIESSERTKEEIRIRQVQKELTDLQKKLSTVVNESTKFNGVYYLDTPLRIYKSSLLEYPQYKALRLNVSMRNKEVTNLKVTVKFNEHLENPLTLHDIVFSLEKTGRENDYISKEEKVDNKISIDVLSIKTIDIYIHEIKYSPQDFEFLDQDLMKQIPHENIETLYSLSKVAGSDTVHDYLITDTHWICYCGHENSKSLTTCSLCNRAPNDFIDKDSFSSIATQLSGCSTLDQAKEIIHGSKDFIPKELFTTISEQLDKDLYIKKMYGMKDEKKAIKAYEDMLDQ